MTTDTIFDKFPVWGYIVNLCKEVHKCRYNDTVTGKKNMLECVVTNGIFVLLSGLVFLFVPYIESDVLNSLITAFSILVGLLANLLMTLYSVSQKKKDEKTDTDLQRLYKERDLRFFKQFGYLVSYAIFLSVIGIILAILNQLPDPENELPTAYDLLATYSFSTSIEDITFASKIFGFCFIKGVFSYVLLDLFHIVLYAVSSFIDYLNREIS